MRVMEQRQAELTLVGTARAGGADEAETDVLREVYAAYGEWIDRLPADSVWRDAFTGCRADLASCLAA